MAGGPGQTITVGVVADTHGLLRPQLVDALRGVDRILHAGDIGRPYILDKLKAIAPLSVVRGNVDREEWAEALPKTEVIQVGSSFLYMLHILEELDLDPGAAGFAAVIYGHSHQPRIERKDGVLYLNPGSAGPRRFSLPVSLAIMKVSAQGLDADLIELDV
jgi:putative phosphoesterase